MMAKKKIAIAVAVSLFAVVSLCGMALVERQTINASETNDGKDGILDCAALVDDENRMLVGKEVQDDTPLTAMKGMQEKMPVLSNISADKIELSFADGVVQPATITSFATENGAVPEVIIPNGSAAIFGQTDDAGWLCASGDELVYQFQKYPSEVDGVQTLVVGYVLNGKMYPGEKFLNVDGEYRCEVKEAGEYFIYVINAASDPLTLKSGNIYTFED